MYLIHKGIEKSELYIVPRYTVTIRELLGIKLELSYFFQLTIMHE